MGKTSPIMSRMKDFYEKRTRSYLPRRTYTIIRLDGKAFHTYTRGLEKPFDEALMEDMAKTTKFLCDNIQGCVMGYTQSDEISLLLTDFKKYATSAWFDGEVQKITSISASMATAYFNNLRKDRQTDPSQPFKMAFFDSRVFTIPESEEVLNYFLARQVDAEINSVSMVGQSVFSYSELHKVSTKELITKLEVEKSIIWGNLHPHKKRGVSIIRTQQESGRNKFTILDDTFRYSDSETREKLIKIITFKEEN